MKGRSRSPRPEVEALEDRFLLAGNVTVKLASDGDDLIVRGDRQANQIVITQPEAGTIRVTGLDGTTVNGQPFADVTAEVEGVFIRMRQGGDDRASILGSFILSGEVDVRMKHGSFSIDGSSGPVRLGEYLSIQTGTSSEVTICNDVRVTDETWIESGGSVHIGAGRALLPDFSKAIFHHSLQIDNPYFPLVVGTKYTYEAQTVDEATGQPQTQTIVVDVLPDTQTILGIATRVVHDQVSVNGLVIEDTRDYYAQDDNGNVWYMGESSTENEYDDQGNLIGTSDGGSFQGGVDGALPGVVMEARPQLGDRYYQEFKQGTALDQAQVLATDATSTVPAGTFDREVQTRDTTVLEPDLLEQKFHAPGIGTVLEYDLDPLSGEITGTTRLISVELNGTSVDELVPTDGFSGTNATGKTTEGIEFNDDVWIRAGDSVRVTGARFGGPADIRSLVDLNLVESVFTHRSLVRAPEAVGLRDVSADAMFQVRNNGAVYVFSSHFHAAATVLLGGDNNTVVVAGSEFHRLTVDGGPGDDVFEDRGDNVFDTLRLKRIRRL